LQLSWQDIFYFSWKKIQYNPNQNNHNHNHNHNHKNMFHPRVELGHLAYKTNVITVRPMELNDTMIPNPLPFLYLFFPLYYTVFSLNHFVMNKKSFCFFIFLFFMIFFYDFFFLFFSFITQPYMYCIVFFVLFF
jgi:hypothetical protein